MKKFTKILALVLVACMAVCMMACSTYGKVEKAFTNEGYTVCETSQNNSAEQIEKDCEDNDTAVTVHLLYKGITFVMVLEFKATDDMIEFYQDSNTAQGFIKDVQEDGTAKEFYDSLVEKGYANGNCLVIPLTIIPSSYNEVLNIVKNA